ncbi:MAG TPA: cyclic dehypoxanthinyl futalosine synthase [Vicinamibacterales bacterium]|nr:cyclic dehypoxanthinyl futalosine synthase [Vicinamibacterales bacterium]
MKPRPEDADPRSLGVGPQAVMMTVNEIATRVRDGARLSAEDALELWRHAPTSLIGQLADSVRQRKHPDGIVTYIIDRNVNYTNVCVARCNFCAFYRPVGSADGYVLGFEELFRKIDETIAVGGVQLLLQGGHNPDLPLSWYEDLFRAIKERYPAFRLHALSPPEVIHLSRLSQVPVSTVVDRLIAAGLDSIPGGGAEILVDRVRKLLHCYSKATADEWLEVMRTAHHAGLRTTATMMYGTVETDEERLEHLVRLRALQDETGGFTAFITWSYQPQHTELGGTEATGIDYLRTLGIARLVLDNFDNLQASWVTQGGKVGQLSLAYGANDMGSVMIEENVVRAAGAAYCMDEAEIVRNIENAGFVAKRRNMHYEILGDPIFRERDVPRMLELATARAEGDTSVPAELRFYPARSKEGKRDRDMTNR